MMLNTGNNPNRLCKAARTLNSKAEEVKALIRELDEKFRSIGLQVKCRPDVRLGKDGPWMFAFHINRGENLRGHISDGRYSLSYGKSDDGTWGIVVSWYALKTNEEGEEVNGDDYEETVWVRALFSCDKDVIMAAVPFLPLLLEELTKLVEQRVQMTAETIERIKATRDSLKESTA